MGAGVGSCCAITEGGGVTGASPFAALSITTAVAVPLMTWVVMPRVTRLLRGWLYPG